MQEIPDKSVDMILCDLPYGTTACKWDTIIPLDPLWQHYKRIIKDSGVVVLTGSEPFSSMLRMSNPVQYKYDWVWDKIAGANFLNIRNRPLKTHENVMVFSAVATFTFNPIRVKRTEKSLKRDKVGQVRKITRTGLVEHYGSCITSTSIMSEDGTKHPIDIIEFPVIENGRLKLRHPTKKPVALFEYLIKTYTNEGETVLDNCAGSGTTAIACINTNRNYICIEKEPKYYEIILDRIKKHTAQQRLW